LGIWTGHKGSAKTFSNNPPLPKMPDAYPHISISYSVSLVARKEICSEFILPLQFLIYAAELIKRRLKVFPKITKVKISGITVQAL